MAIQGHLGCFIFDDGFNDYVAIGHGGEAAGRAEPAQSRNHFFHLHPANVDPSLHDLGDGRHAFFQRLRNAVEQGDWNAAADVRAGDARTHNAGAEDTDALHGFRLDGRIGHAGIFLQPLGHKEYRDQVARNRTTNQWRKCCRLDSKSLVEGKIAALFNGVESRERRRQLSLGLGQHLGPRHGEKIGMLIFAEADGLSLFLPKRFPLFGLLRPFDQSHRLFQKPLAGNGVEDDAQLPRSLGIDRFAGANQLGSQCRPDQARQPLRAAPAGDYPKLHLGQPDFCLRMRTGQSIIECQGQLQPAAYAGALDGSHGRKWKFLKGGEQIETSASQTLSLSRIDQGAS